MRIKPGVPFSQTEWTGFLFRGRVSLGNRVGTRRFRYAGFPEDAVLRWAGLRFRMLARDIPSFEVCARIFGAIGGQLKNRNKAGPAANAITPTRPFLFCQTLVFASDGQSATTGFGKYSETVQRRMNQNSLLFFHSVGDLRCYGCGRGKTIGPGTGSRWTFAERPSIQAGRVTYRASRKAAL